MGKKETLFENKIGKLCFHEKDESVVFKVIDGSEDHVILKQVWPKLEYERVHEYPMRYFNNHFIATEPKR